MAEKTIKMVKVEALVNLKYDKEVVAVGQALEIRETDLENMVDRGLVKLVVTK